MTKELQTTLCPACYNKTRATPCPVCNPKTTIYEKVLELIRYSNANNFSVKSITLSFKDAWDLCGESQYVVLNKLPSEWGFVGISIKIKD